MDPPRCSLQSEHRKDFEINAVLVALCTKGLLSRGATTGQQLLYALDEQVRRWEGEGRVKKWEFWDFLEPVVDDDGRCIGAVCQDMVTMKFKAFPADAVILASGGCGLLYGRSTMSMICTGSAVSRAYKAGVKYGNAEFYPSAPNCGSRC